MKLVLTLLTVCCSTVSAFGACYGPREQLNIITVNEFTADPGKLLQQFPGGGAQMIARIRDLAASNPGTLQHIVQLLATATKDQKKAIGAALAQAARICVRAEQAYATEIQNLLANTRDTEAIIAFTAIAGDQPIAATGGGGGAGAGGGGGAIGGPLNLPSSASGGSSLQTWGSFSKSTFQFTISSSVSGGASFSTVTNVNVSVSP